MVYLSFTNVIFNTPRHSDSEIKIEKDSTVTINGRKPSISGMAQSMPTQIPSA